MNYLKSRAKGHGLFEIMSQKYFNLTGEIAFRLWMFSNAVEVLKKTPNPEKAQNLKTKMEAFSAVIAEKGSFENLQDIKELIDEL
ncbi:MAG: hypothetical protein IJ525_03485 [Alphaproteobacteria bacterium]|nr:hypothetical protein [Alphaproteobacteria bacterium]